MAEENEDLNKGQSVADPDLSQPVTGTDLNASGQGEEPAKLANGDDESKKTVKYTEFKKANEAKNTAEEENQLLRNQMALMANNPQVAQTTSQTQQPVMPATPYDQARAELGLADEEYLTESVRSKVIARATEIQNAAHQQQAQLQANQQFAQTHADLGEVVGRYIGNQFQPSSELLKILSEKPHLAAAASTNEGAYKIVMEERELAKLRQQNTVQEEHLKQQGIDTKLAPVSGAAAGGGAAVTTTSGTVTLEQQRENEQRVANGEFNQKG